MDERLRTTDQHAVPTRNHLHLRLRPRVLANVLQVATIDRSTMPDNVIGDGSAATGTLRLAGTLDAQRWEIRSADDATESSSSLSVNVEDHFNSSYSRRPSSCDRHGISPRPASVTTEYCSTG